MNDNVDDIFNGLGVEIEIKPTDFLKIKETLSRIGVGSTKTNTLYQSCHILHKRGRYAIVHYKEMFELDGRETTITENDVARRNTIAGLLEQWGLAKILDDDVKEPVVPVSSIKILPYSQKSKWTLKSKYTIGRKQ